MGYGQPGWEAVKKDPNEFRRAVGVDVSEPVGLQAEVVAGKRGRVGAAVEPVDALGIVVQFDHVANAGALGVMPSTLATVTVAKRPACRISPPEHGPRGQSRE